MGQPIVALATSAAIPDGTDDDARLRVALDARELPSEPVVWDDPAVRWDAYAAVVIRSTWDYQERRDAFLDWVRSVPSIVNPAEVVVWNTDKRYLRDLAYGGLPVVPTRWMEPADAVTLPRSGEWVLKPSIGASAVGAARFDLGRTPDARAAVAHARSLLAAGHAVMVQPYVTGIESSGEVSLMFFDDRFSHAVRKAPMLRLGDDPMARRRDRVEAATATEAELELARRVLRAIPGASTRWLTYARIDLVPAEDGAPQIIEVELTEPSMFLRCDDRAAGRFADAIAGWIRRGDAPGERPLGAST